MKNIFGWLFYILLTSCVTINEVDENVSSISKYTYSIDGTTETAEVLNEIFENGELLSKYSEMIKRKYDQNQNLLEEAKFNLRNDSPILENYIKNQYDEQGRLIISIDSMKMLTVQSQNTYDQNRLINSKSTTTYFEPKQMGDEEVWISVNSSVNDSYYEYENSLNIVTRSIYSETGKFNPDGEQQYDTLITYHEYDINQDQIQSLAITKSDTISITKRKFDTSHNEVEVTTSFNNGIIDKSRFVYDKNGNMTASRINSKMHSEKLEMSYNENNQLIQRTSYKTK